MIVFLASWLLLQDKAAEEAFRKLEEKIGSAKTLTIRITSSGHTTLSGLERGIKVSGTLLLKEGNRLLLTLSIDGGGRPTELRQISDGTSIRRTRSGAAEEVGETPGTLFRNSGVALARLGAHLSYGASAPPPGGTSDLAESLQLSGFKEEPADPGSRGLSYVVTPRATGIPVRITLVYDPEKGIPLRRKIEIKEGETAVSFVETYEEFTLNADIPDEKFTLPKTPLQPGVALPPPRVAPPAEVVIKEAPPPPMQEVRPPAPTPDHVWIDGYWKWNGKSFTWIRGSWLKPPRPDAVWVPGHWEKRDGGWTWSSGSWK